MTKLETIEEVLKKNKIVRYRETFMTCMSMAMTEWAKQEAIAFAEWIAKNCSDDLDRYNTKGLYSMYVESKTE